MKRKYSFWVDLERYTWKKLQVLSPALPMAGSGLIVVVIIASVLNANSSVVGARDPRELVERAARVGDYESAREMLNVLKSQMTNSQMKQGSESELERLVYPERVIEREIEKYEDLLLTYPGNLEIYLTLSQLHAEIGNDERAAEYRENARILDPNNEIFKAN